MSDNVGRLLYDLIRQHFQRVRVYISSNSIALGERWEVSLGAALEEHYQGILCLTPANRDNRWLLFEAGALSKSFDDSRVTCLLLDELDHSDVPAPLGQFQNMKPVEAEMRKLLGEINSATSEPLESDVFEKTFTSFWKEFQHGYSKALEEYRSRGDHEKVTSRSIEDILEEILGLARANHEATQKLLAGRFAGKQPAANTDLLSSDEVRRHIADALLKFSGKPVSFRIRRDSEGSAGDDEGEPK